MVLSQEEVRKLMLEHYPREEDVLSATIASWRSQGSPAKKKLPGGFKTTRESALRLACYAIRLTVLGPKRHGAALKPAEDAINVDAVDDVPMSSRAEAELPVGSALTATNESPRPSIATANSDYGEAQSVSVKLVRCDTCTEVGAGVFVKRGAYKPLLPVGDAVDDASVSSSEAVMPVGNAPTATVESPRPSIATAHRTFQEAQSRKRKAPVSSCEYVSAKEPRAHRLTHGYDQANLQSADDAELVVLSAVKVSLLCPISTKRMETAVRGKNCTHLHCFDRLSFLGLSKKAIGQCPFAFCGQKVRVDDLVVDGLLNKALRDTAPSVKEIELLDGSFKAVTSNETHRDVMVLDDDAPDIVDCQVPMESEVEPMLSIGTEVHESLHDALTSIDSKLEAHKLAYLSDVRKSFHDMRDFVLQKFSTMQASESSAVRLSVAKELHALSTKVFQLAAKQLQKYQDSTNPGRPRASASKQWLHDIAHATVALHALIKERVLGAPKMIS